MEKLKNTEILKVRPHFSVVRVFRRTTEKWGQALKKLLASAAKNFCSMDVQSDQTLSFSKRSILSLTYL